MKKKQILIDILDWLDKDSIEYSVIHHADSLDSQLSSDIDLVLNVSPEKTIRPILKKMQSDKKIQLLHCLHYEISDCYYYIIGIQGEATEFLHLDVMYDPFGSNHYLYTSADLLYGKRYINNVWTTAPEKEATYLLIKKAYKGKINKETHERIFNLANTNKAEFENECMKWWSHKCFDSILKFIKDENETNWDAQLCMLRDGLKEKIRSRGGLMGLRRVFQEGLRRIHRVLSPSGLFVVLLGPDGAGKSTIANIALNDLKRGFRRIDHFHWRPGLFPKPGRTSQHLSENNQPLPPTSYKYGYAMSLIRYVYFLLDFIFGYWTRIYRARVSTSLILGERWYYDVILNPMRYGFRLPNWLLCLGGYMIPSPDLVILLYADPENMHKRKPELTIEQIQQQLNDMKSMVDALPYGACISSNSSVEETVGSFVKLILEKQSSKYL